MDPKECVVRTLCLLSLTLYLAGCTGLQLYTLPPDEYERLAANPAEQAKYRSSVRSCTADMEKPEDPRISELCDFAIIEFDDQGEFLYPDLPGRPGHLRTALHRLHQVSRPGQEALVVVFVHGWKNDASPRNEEGRNLASFKEALRDLTRAGLERCDLGDKAFCTRPVMGIYMAWHGETFRTPILRFLSYFPRREAAEAVGRVGFSHALHRIVNHAKGRKAGLLNGKPKRGNPDSIVVVVGHSLGAVILENTLLRSLTIETDDFREDFPVDLAVSVNSANEAILTRQFVHGLDNAPPPVAQTNNVVLPLLVSVTSRGDWATRFLTPPSQRIRGLGKSLRRYDPVFDGPNGRDRQTYYYRHTAGHTGTDAALRSHDVSCRTSSPDCSEIPRTKESAAEEVQAGDEPRRDLFDPPAIRLVDCPAGDEIAAEVEESRPRCIESLWFRGAQQEEAAPELYEIHRIAGSSNRTPFWIIQLPKRIVPNHSLIFQSEFVSMLAALVGIPWAHEVETFSEAERWLLGGQGAAEGASTLTSH